MIKPSDSQETNRRSEASDRLRAAAPWLLAAGWTLVLLVLAVVPSGAASAVAVPDWAAHFGAYAVQAVLVMWAARAGGAKRWRGAVLAIGWAASLGLVTEGLQAGRPDRAAELGDLVADIAGAVAGTGLVTAWWWVRRQAVGP